LIFSCALARASEAKAKNATDNTRILLSSATMQIGGAGDGLLKKDPAFESIG
jgi:hypothetical protein